MEGREKRCQTKREKVKDEGGGEKKGKLRERRIRSGVKGGGERNKKRQGARERRREGGRGER